MPNDYGLASAQWEHDTQEGPGPFENESEENINESL